jgi:hypothetical protein
MYTYFLQMVLKSVCNEQGSGRWWMRVTVKLSFVEKFVVNSYDFQKSRYFACYFPEIWLHM